MVAAHKLYPEAQISLGGAVNRNVREFQALYADAIPVVDPTDVDRDSVRRLILVDTVHANRLGDLGDLCGREGVQVVAFDHHAHPDDLPDYLDPDALVSSDDGSLVTLLVRIIAERGIPVTPFEATVFALGIHEDTGSLTFATTTTRDAEALAYCMRAGADTAAARALADQRAHAGAAGHAGRRAADRAGAAHRPGVGAPLGPARGPLRGGRQRRGPPGHGPDGLRRLLPAGGDGGPRVRDGAQPRRQARRRRGAARRGRRRAHRRRLGRRQGPPSGGGRRGGRRGGAGGGGAHACRARRSRARPADHRGHHARGRGRAALPPRRPRRARRAPRRPARRARRPGRPRAGLGPRPRSRAGQGGDDDARAARVGADPARARGAAPGAGRGRLAAGRRRRARRLRGRGHRPGRPARRRHATVRRPARRHASLRRR